MRSLPPLAALLATALAATVAAQQPKPSPAPAKQPARATPAPASAATPAPAAPRPPAPEVEPLTPADISSAKSTDALSVPMPGELFAALGKQCKPAWAGEFRPAVGTQFNSRVQLALNLGGLIADGYLAVEAQDAAQVRNVGRDILFLAKSLGISAEITARGKTIIDFADAGEWNALKEELEATQNEVKLAMERIKDQELVTLISLGGWVRGTQAVSSLIVKNFSENTAALVRQPALVAYLRSKLAALPPKLRADPLVGTLDTGLAEMETLVSFPRDQVPSQEAVQKLRDTANGLIKQISAK